MTKNEERLKTLEAAMLGIYLEVSEAQAAYNVRRDAEMRLEEDESSMDEDTLELYRDTIKEKNAYIMGAMDNITNIVENVIK